MSVREFEGYIYGLRGDFRAFLEKQDMNNGLVKIQASIGAYARNAFESCSSVMEEDLVIENLAEVFREFMEEQRSKMKEKEVV